MGSRTPSRLKGDFARLVGSGIASQLLLVISAPLTARMVGPEGRGELAVCLVLSILGARLAVGGMPLAVVRAVAAAQAPARSLLRGHPRRWLVRGCLVGAALVPVVALMTRHSTNGGWLPVVTSLMTVAGTMQAMWTSMVFAEGSTRSVTFVQLAPIVAYVVAITTLFVLPVTPSVEFVALCYLGSQILGLVISHRRLQSIDPEVEALPRVPLSAASRKLWIASVRPSAQGIDQLVAAAFLNPAAVGLYAVATSITNVSVPVFLNLGNMLLSRMSATDPRSAAAAMRRWALGSLGVGAAIIASLEVVLEPLLRIMFGQEFLGATSAARILVVAWVMFSFRLILTAALQAQHRDRATSWLELATASLTATACSVGAVVGGISGVALAFGVVNVVMCLAMAALLDWSPAREGREDLA